jgi:predicted aldo/keto reductase-like oxidoreductase
MIAPVLARNRNRVFLASKSDARDYEGFKRDLDRSLQVLRTDHIDLYNLHDMQPQESANLNAIESGAVVPPVKPKRKRSSAHSESPATPVPEF